MFNRPDGLSPGPKNRAIKCDMFTTFGRVPGANKVVGWEISFSLAYSRVLWSNKKVHALLEALYLVKKGSFSPLLQYSPFPFPRTYVM